MWYGVDGLCFVVGVGFYFFSNRYDVGVGVWDVGNGVGGCNCYYERVGEVMCFDVFYKLFLIGVGG